MNANRNRNRNVLMNNFNLLDDDTEDNEDNEDESFESSDESEGVLPILSGRLHNNETFQLIWSNIPDCWNDDDESNDYFTLDWDRWHFDAETGSIRIGSAVIQFHWNAKPMCLPRTSWNEDAVRFNGTSNTQILVNCGHVQITGAVLPRYFSFEETLNLLKSFYMFFYWNCKYHTLYSTLLVSIHASLIDIPPPLHAFAKFSSTLWPVCPNESQLDYCLFSNLIVFPIA